MSNGFLFAPSARAQKSPPPRLPQPLTPESLKGLMRTEAYRNTMHPQFPTYRRVVQRGFEILYPGNAKYDATGRMIDAEPLPPHFVAGEVEKANQEMAAMEGGGESLSGDGMVHVQSHTRDGGKVEVSDYWRNRPGEGGDDDTLHGQSGADTLPPGGEPPKGAFVAADPDKLVKDWTGKHVGESDQCVALVKKAIPEIGPTPGWREGEKLLGPNDPPLKPGTAIATFENGKYPDRPAGNHAAIVIGPGVHDGKEGYWVLDQWRDHPAGRRFLAFDSPSKLFSSRLENYSVIRKGL